MSGTVCVWLVLVPATAASSIPHFKFVVFGYSQCYGNCANDRWGVRTKFWAGTFVCGLAGLVALPYDTSCWLFCIHCAVSAARLAVAFGVKYLTPSQAGGEASANRCPECGLDVREHPQNDACSYHRKRASDMNNKCPECELDVELHPQNDACGCHRKQCFDTLARLSSRIALQRRASLARRPRRCRRPSTRRPSEPNRGPSRRSVSLAPRGTTSSSATRSSSTRWSRPSLPSPAPSRMTTRAGSSSAASARRQLRPCFSAGAR